MSILSLDKSFTPIQQDVKFKPLSEVKESVSDVKKENISSLAQQEAGNDLEKQLKEAVGQINNTIRTYRTELEFTIHKESGRVSVKVIDSRDDSVIREIPPERVLDFAAHVKKMLGVIFDEFI